MVCRQKTQHVHNFKQSAEGKMMKQAYLLTEVANYFKVSDSSIRDWLEKDPSSPRPFRKYGILPFRCSEIERYGSDRRSRSLGQD